MAAALEPFFKNGDGPASRATLRWDYNGYTGIGIVRWRDGQSVDIAVRDAAADSAGPLNAQVAPARSPAGQVTDSPKAKYGIERNGLGDHVVVDCGYFRLSWWPTSDRTPTADHDSIKRASDFVERDHYVDLDGLAAIKPEQ